MMTYPLYQIYRPKAKVFRWSSPIVAENDDVALSSFRELALSQPELSCSYLYAIGTFSAVTGKIKLLKKPRLVKEKCNDK